MSMQTDESLSERLQQGDQEALGELFGRYQSRLHKMVQYRLDRRICPRVDADDVLQEAYLDALTRLKHFDPSGHLTPFLWLRLIVQQTVIAVHRRHLGAKKRDAGREISIHPANSHASSPAVAALLLGQLTSPSQAALRVELGAQLEESLETLSELDREVLVLRHFEELSNSEIAAVLDLTQKAASIRYVRAISRLKKVLAKIPGFFEMTNLTRPASETDASEDN